MKELSIEEKAKRYDETIERANSLLSGNQLGNAWIYKLLPELRESEGKRIRKWLIALIKSNEYGSISNVGEMPCSKLNVLAWLEKQGEQKPADKIEPKFHEGDIIKPKDGGHEPWQIMQVDMFDNKYRFKDGYVIHFSQEDDYDLVEQKPWSEENETVLNNLIYALANDRIGNNRDEYVDWLKSLKERVQPQILTVTDEELIKARNEAYNDALDKLEYHSDTPTFNDGWSAAIWYLKKRNAQPQNKWKPNKLQIEALDTAIRCGFDSGTWEEALNDLLWQLKKLREE